MLTLVVPFAVGALATRAHAQDSTRTRRLQSVRVTVTREGSRSVLDLPFGVSRLQVDSGRSGIRRASLTEGL